MKLKHFAFMAFMALAIVSCQKEPALTTQMEEQFHFRNNGNDMPVYVRGNGASKVFVLILHGGPGDGGFKYANHTFSNALETDYAMVYWDQRHQGNSHGHLNPEAVTIDAMVEDTYLLIKTLKKRYGNDISLFLMGHSWGGTLGTSFMIKSDYQSEVKGWIESGGAHDFPLMNTELIKMIQTIAPEEIAAANHVEKWTEILNYTNALDPNNVTPEQTSQLNSYAGIAESLITTLTAKTQVELGDFERYFGTPNNPIGVDANALTLPQSFYEEIISNSLSSELYKIKTPTLLLWGKYDFKVPKALGEKALETIGTADKYLKIYETSGHSSMRYQPDEFVTDVKQFIETYK